EKASPPVSELFDFSQPPKTEMERLMRDAFLKKDQGKGKRGKGERTRDRDYDEEGEPGRKRRKGQDDENSNQRNRGGARNNTRHYLDESESDFDG
ncbi:MAG: hypothetical protein K8F91_01905, partial [Candidatus Obscuribacterales bacterium]|nr:hypothetical protein [Candidatus Obscuribacterales bacterium]